MGYSARQSAFSAADFVSERICPPPGSANQWSYRGQLYFWERGREHDDGRITGTVYRVIDNRCYKVGTLHIDADGYVRAWPCIPREVLADVRAMYKASQFRDEYREAYLRAGCLAAV